MNLYSWRFISTLLFLSGVSLSAKADHIQGGYITYEHLESSKYLVKVMLYRNCEGIPWGTITVNVSGSSSFNLTATQQSTKDLTPLCSSTSCSNPIGVQLLEFYTDTVYLSGCSYVFSYGECCRSAGITTGSADTEFYIESTLDRCNTGDHSGVILQVPISSNCKFCSGTATLVSCKGECVTQRVSAFGIDDANNTQGRDSFTYELTKVLESKNYSVTWNSGYSYLNPVTYSGSSTKWDGTKCEGILLDRNTGELGFKPDTTDFTPIAVKVNYYQKNSSGIFKLAGYFTHEFQIRIIDCPGASPTISGIDKTSATEIIVCQDEPVSFIVEASDKDGDKVSIDYSLNDFTVPKPEVKIKTGTQSSATATVTWKPDSAAKRTDPYNLLIEARDDGCPVRRYNYTMFKVWVKDKFPAITYSVHQIGCAQYEMKVKKADSSLSIGLKWIIDRKQVSGADSFTYIASRLGFIPIEVHLKAPSGCIKKIYDTILVTKIANADAGRDTGHCTGGKVQLKGGPGVKYKWTGDTTISDPAIRNPWVSADTTKYYYLQVTDSSGCIGIDSVRVVVEDPDFEAGRDTGLCSYSNKPVQLSATFVDSFATYRWYPTAGLYDSTLSTVSAKPAVTTTYKVTMTTRWGCSKTDSVTVFVSHPKTDAGPDRVLCYGDSVQLHAAGGVVYKWSPAAGLKDVNVPDPYVRPLADNEYTVFSWDSFGCSSSDKVKIKVVKVQPVVNKSIAPFCPGDTVRLSASGGNKYQWWPAGAMLDSMTASPRVIPNSTTQYFVRVTDTVTGCSKIDSVTVPMSTDCVWPGDADKNKTADYKDILNIGIGYGVTGPARNDTSTLWHPYTAGNWSKSFPNGANYKHADANGDGKIDAVDTIAVSRNYGKKHLKDEPQLLGSPGDLPLYFEFEKDTFYAGDTVNIKLMLGSIDHLTLNSCGVAVQHAVATQWMVPGTYAFQFVCDVFCDTGSALFYYKTAPPATEATMVRTDHKGVYYFGPVGHARFVLKDSTAGYPGDGDWLRIGILDALVADVTGKPIPVYATGDSARVYKSRDTEDTSTSINEFDPGRIKVFPNPAHRTITVEVNNTAVKTITLYNAVGESVYSEEGVAEKKVQIPVSRLTPGLYFIAIKTQEGVLLKKIVIHH